jgi:hypothetical protein
VDNIKKLQYYEFSMSNKYWLYHLSSMTTRPSFSPPADISKKTLQGKENHRLIKKFKINDSEDQGCGSALI